MKYAPRKVYIKESSGYVELSYTDFCRRRLCRLSSGFLRQVRNSYLGDSVYLEGQCVGGIYGSGDMKNFGPGMIENCYVLATINCHGTRWSAIYAETWARSSTITVENFYSTSRLVDGDLPGTVQTSYGNVKAEAGYIGSMADGNKMYLGDAFRAVEGGLPVLKVFDHNDMAWGGLGGYLFEGGDGSEDAPYQIATAEQLAYMVYSGGNGKNYELVNDIVITDLDAVNWATGELKENLGYTPEDWFGGNDNGGMYYKTVNSDTGRFSGNFNGNGFKVSGLYYAPYYSGRDIAAEGKWITCTGLIPAISGGKISNFMLTDSYVWNGRFVGAVVGYTCGTTTLSNIAVDNTVTVIGLNTGKENGYIYKEANAIFESSSGAGIVGYAQGTLNMDNCGTSAKVTATSHLNGLVAFCK